MTNRFFLRPANPSKSPINPETGLELATGGEWVSATAEWYNLIAIEAVICSDTASGSKSSAPPRGTPASVGSTSAAFSTRVPFTNLVTKLAAHTVSAALDFVPITVRAVAGAKTILTLTADGRHRPTFSGFIETGGDGWNNLSGSVNLVEFFYDGTNYRYSVTRGGVVETRSFDSALGGVPANPTVVLTGDSILYRTGKRSAWTTASSEQQIDDQSADGWFTWLNFLLGCPFKKIINNAVAGRRTNDMVLNFQADCIANNPQLVVLAGGVNDLDFVGYDAAVSFANLRHMVERAIAECDARVILQTVSPGNLVSPGGKAHRIALNNLILDYAAGHNRVVSADFSDLVENGSGNWISGMASDGTHPSSNIAVYSMARRLADKLRGLYPPVMLTTGGIDNYDGAGSPATGSILVGQNLLTKAASLFTANGGTPWAGTGTITGNIPAGWMLQNGSGSAAVTSSRIARSDVSGAFDWEIQVNNTAQASPAYVIAYYTMDSLFSNGSFYELAWDMEAVSGHASLYSLSGGVTNINAPSDYTSFMSSLANVVDTPWPVITGKQLCRAPRYLFASGDSLRIVLPIYVKAGGNATVRLGLPSLRKFAAVY